MLAQPGIQLIINAYDNHGMHLEEHGLAKKQPEYQRLKFDDPDAFVRLETTFFMHEKQHQGFLAEQQAANDARAAKVVRMQKGGKGSGG